MGAEQLAASQSAFRASNERLRRAAASHRFEAADRLPFVCECADRACYEIVMLSIEEYERVRAQPTWFVLVAGHEDDEAGHERIVEAENGYAIVEKTGAAGTAAARLNPRHDERVAGSAAASGVLGAAGSCWWILRETCQIEGA
jgi:hypothetical protein